MQNGIKQKDKTSISSSTSIVGNIKAEDNLIINGTLKGNVEIGDYNFLLSPNGRLEGEVHAQNVRIRGHMKGEIKAKGKVDITKEADFSGKIKSKSISVEKGAYFDAYVDLGRESPETGTLEETSFEKPITELL
jgi:cytoskeletal protein CcmA (bactofilin family)